MSIGLENNKEYLVKLESEFMDELLNFLESKDGILAVVFLKYKMDIIYGLMEIRGNKL